MKKNLKHLSFHSFLLGIYTFILFFTPLLFLNFANESFEFPKIFLIYFFGISIFSCFCINRILYPQKIIYPNKLVIIFVLINILSTLFSVHPYTSFWGYYGRFNDGLFSTVVFFMLYFVAINTFSKSEFLKLLTMILISSIPVSIYGIFQHLISVDRVYSTFGQPNWLGQYLAILLMCVLYFIFMEKKPIVWFLIYFLGFSCLWFTYSLSAFLGFFVAILACLIYFVKFPLSKESILKVVILFGFSFIVIFTNLSFFSNRLNDTFIDIKNFFVQNTVAFADTSGHTVSDAGFIRFGIWDGSLRLFFSSPKNVVIGTGPETFAYVFQKFRPTVLNYSSEWDFILNKPHNYYIEVLTELGLFGLFVYLILLYQLLKFSPPYLFGGIVAFIVTNFFGWPCVFLNLLFWIFLTYEKYETE